MVRQFNHTVAFDNGASLWLPPGAEKGSLKLPNVYADETIAQYPIGAKFMHADRIFRYCLAGGALGGLKRLVINGNHAPGVTGHTNDEGFEGAIYAAAAIGSTYVDIADTASRAADYYRGAHIAIYGTTIFHDYYCVRSNAGTTAYVRCYLLDVLAEEAITTAMGVTAYRSPYINIMGAGTKQVGFETFMGVPMCPVASGSYFWMQTAGPCIITAHGGSWPGAASNQRAVYAHQDGTIDPASVKDPSNGHFPIGQLLSATGGTGSDYGDLWVQLQLDT